MPTSTSNYTVLINNIAAAKPDAVAELGFPGNDIAFLRNLQDSGEKFRFLFSIYAGEEFDLLRKNVGADGLTMGVQLRAAVELQLQGEFRDGPRAVQGGVGQEVSEGLGHRFRRQRDLRLP